MISVIIPAYNAEKSIYRCIHSVLCQTYNNIEIIVIDDGSSDRTKNICERLQKTDNRILLISQDNGGVSRARNRGIEVASGDYITFVDSDDYLKKTFLEDSMKIFLEYKVDIVRTPYIRKIGLIHIAQKNNIIKNAIISINNYTKEIYKKIGMGNTIDTACVNVFKVDCIKDVRFNETLSYGEDTMFMIEALSKAKNGIYVYDKPSYVYVYDKNESTNDFDEDKWLRRLKDFKEVFIKNASSLVYRTQGVNIEKELIEKYEKSIIGIINLSIVNNSYLRHKEFVKKLK